MASTTNKELLYNLVCEVAWGVTERASGGLGDHGMCCVNEAAEEITTHIDSVLDGVAEGTEMGDMILKLLESLKAWED